MKKIPRYITVEMLRNRNFCKKQIKLFERTFGSSARVTKSNITKAARAGLDLWWFVYAYVPILSETVHMVTVHMVTATFASRAEVADAIEGNIAAVPELWSAIKDHIA